jgi:hypothetical protein
MKLKVFLIILLASIYQNISAFGPGISTEDSLVHIRESVTEILQTIDKDAVAINGEEIKICFSVDESGTVYLHKVLWASDELRQELNSSLHHAVIVGASDTGRLMWMTVKLNSRRF